MRIPPDFSKEILDHVIPGTRMFIVVDGVPLLLPLFPVDGAITNTLRIPATRASDFGSYAVMVGDAFGNPLVTNIVWLTESPVRESPTSISQSDHMLIKFNSQFGGFIERSRNLVDWVTFINVPAGESEISVNINADDHEFFRLKEQN